MQTQTERWIELHDSGELAKIIDRMYEKLDGKKPDEEKPNKKSENEDYIDGMMEAAELALGNGNIKHGKQDYDKWTKEKKIEYCSRRVINFGIRKGYNGFAERIPRYCNHCEECYKAKSLELKEKIIGISERVLEEKPNGQWRKKIVSDKEARALKKKIKRNQDGRHIEIACVSNPNKVEVWSYVEDEPKKDMQSSYGETANPVESIDFDKLYKENRSTGKKMSTGAGFRKPSSPAKKADTERVLLPDIIIKDVARQEEAEKIVQSTNFIKEAETAEQAKRLYSYQFKLILKALEEASIEIAAIKMSFFDMAKDEIVRQWNMNVKYWMSINAPLSSTNGAKVDTSYLVYPKSGKKEVNEPVIQQ